MLNCRQVTHMLSQGLDRPLSVAERFRLRLHLMMCRGCSNYRAQMNFLRLATRHYRGRDKDG